jgi:DNA polymerase III epsilon subunit-like protein
VRIPPFSFVVLDTETTGFVPRVHHVIEYAAMRAEGGEIVDTYEQLFSVKEVIPPHVQVLTRIKPEAIAGKPVFEEKLAEIEAKLSGVDLLVGQNLGFDIGMLRGEGIDLTERPWIDTSMLASLVYPEFRSFSLQYMSRSLKLNHEPAHRALGDVRATLELLCSIWERLLELPPDQLAFAKDVMSRGNEGYRIFFEALPDSVSKKATWMLPRTRAEVVQKEGRVSLDAPPVGTVELHEEGLHCACMQEIVNGALEDTSTVHWIAVKNLESTLKRIHIPEGVTVIHPPQLLLNPEAAEALSTQENYTTDEALLRLKLEWFNPRKRNDVALHGNEKDLWNGKMACASTSPVYVDQFKTDSTVFLLDHRQLLGFLADPAHAAHGALKNDAHIIVEDASMLEDTATKAYGHFIALDGLRAAAGTDADLVRFTDLLALFIELIRNNEDQHFLQPADLRKPEADALRERVATFLTRTDLPEKTTEQLKQVQALLDINLPATQITWIERRMDGAVMYQSAPKSADALLHTYLYSRYATTLLVPKGAGGVLPEIVPKQTATRIVTDADFSPCPLTVSFPQEMNLTAFMQNPPPGKTIVLASSKRVIEQMFIIHTERLEDQGVTLICQGMSGGQGRMESEFIAAESPAILMITPFMYEGLDFPEGTADRIVLDSVPFDHPNHPVMSRRREHYRNAFSEYSMPRVEYRLFRLMRSFCRHRRENAEMMVFDKRLFEKDYGARLQRYMAQFATNAPPIVETPAEMQSSAIKKLKKPAAKKEPKQPKEKADGQLQLPL